MKLRDVPYGELFSHSGRVYLKVKVTDGHLDLCYGLPKGAIEHDGTVSHYHYPSLDLASFNHCTETEVFQTVPASQIKSLSTESKENPTSNPELALDTTADRCRALHRIVRSMHDGHCPSCGFLAPAEKFVMWFTSPVNVTGHYCPNCKFHITSEEAKKALAEFRPYLQKSVEIFEAWRKSL